MKLTQVLGHAKHFYWGKGWGPRQRINTDGFYYRRQIKANRVRPVEVYEQTLPEGVKPVDLNAYIKKQLQQPKQDFELPWPYSPRPIKGTPDDPRYQATPALVYQRHKRLLEPVKLPLHFSNSVLNEGLPSQIQSLVDGIQLEPEFVDLARKRVDWCLSNDAAMRKLPLNREFPYLDQKPPRTFGIATNRKESSLLQTLYDLSNLWISKQVGFGSNFVVQRFSNPYCVHSFERDGAKVVLDLECDFVTLLTPIHRRSERLSIKEFDDKYEEHTKGKSLSPIHPVTWQIGFDSKNFYQTNTEFQIPSSSAIQSIFLSNNNVRFLSTQDYQGRSIMFSYGYALKQAQLLARMDRPIALQCFFTSPREFDVGFVLFQLNTTNWDDDRIRNQVWFGDTLPVKDNLEAILKNLIAVQMRSFV